MKKTEKKKQHGRCHPERGGGGREAAGREKARHHLISRNMHTQLTCTAAPYSS